MYELKHRCNTKAILVLKMHNKHCVTAGKFSYKVKIRIHIDY